VREVRVGDITLIILRGLIKKGGGEEWECRKGQKSENSVMSRTKESKEVMTRGISRAPLSGALWLICTNKLTNQIFATNSSSSTHHAQTRIWIKGHRLLPGHMRVSQVKRRTMVKAE